MKLLSRDAILSAADLVYEDVEVPEWGGVVRVKALSGRERDKYEASVTERKGKKTSFNLANLRARLVQLATVDEEGKPLFNPRDIEALGKKSAAALDRVFGKALEMAGMTDEDLEEMAEDFD